MTDVEILLLVVAAIYLSECVLWLDAGCLVLTGVPGRMRRAAAPDVLANERRRLFVLNPVPAATTLVARHPAALFCHTGVLYQRSDRSWQLIAFSQITASEVSAVGHQVRIGEHAYRVVGARAAAQHCRFLKRLAASATFESHVDARLQRYTDPHRAGRRINVLCERLLILQQLQLMLLTWILGAGAILYYFHTDPWQTLFRYLLVAFLIWVATVGVAWRCSRRMNPRESAERWKNLFLSCVSPMHAVRASDRLSLDGLGDQHPLAVAIAAMPIHRLLPLAKQQLAELRNPVAPEQVISENAPETLAALTEARESLADALAQSLSDIGIDVIALSHPDQQDQDAIRWCPRCFDQYTITIDHCPNCPGISTRLFPAHHLPERT